MTKKIKYGILIILIIVLAIIAYLFIYNKSAKNDLGKTKNVPVLSAQEQAIENVKKEAKVREEANKAEIQQIRAEVDLKVKEDLARRAQAELLSATASSTASTTTAASSPEPRNVNIIYGGNK